MQIELHVYVGAKRRSRKEESLGCGNGMGNAGRKKVERQAQHRPDRLSKPRTGSVGTDWLGRVRKPVSRPVRKKDRIGAETGRPSDRYSAREYIWELE